MAAAEAARREDEARDDERRRQDHASATDAEREALEPDEPATQKPTVDSDPVIEREPTTGSNPAVLPIDESAVNDDDSILAASQVASINGSPTAEADDDEDDADKQTIYLLNKVRLKLSDYE